MQVDRIVTITDDTYHYTAGYYVTNKWIDNNTLVLLRSKNDIMKTENELVIASLIDGSIKVIDTNVSHGTFSEVKSGKIYYNDKDGIIELDVESDTKKYIC